MNATQLISYIHNIQGVTGCWIADQNQSPIASEVPEVLDQQTQLDIATQAFHALETFRTEMPDCAELLVELTLCNLIIRDLDGFLLLIMVDPGAKLANVRIGSNVAAKRFDRKALSAAPADPAAPEEAAPSSGSRPSGLSSLLFGNAAPNAPAKSTTPPPEKPKKGKGIWG